MPGVRATGFGGWVGGTVEGWRSTLFMAHRGARVTPILPADVEAAKEGDGGVLALTVDLLDRLVKGLSSSLIG